MSGRHRGHQLVAPVQTLREIRVRQNLSLAELQELCGISKGILSQIERGRLVASDEELAAITQALRLPRQLQNRLVPVFEQEQAA